MISGEIGDGIIGWEMIDLLTLKRAHLQDNNDVCVSIIELIKYRYSTISKEEILLLGFTQYMAQEVSGGSLSFGTSYSNGGAREVLKK